MRTSIIIPVYNNFEYTEQLIESIEKHTKGYDFVIVNDGSTDETKEWLYESSMYFVQHEKNEGFTKSVNDGLRHALKVFPQNEYLCVMNNDILVTEGWLKELIDVLEHNKRTMHVVYPLFSSGNHAPLMPPIKTNQIKEIGFGSFCFVMRRQVLHDVGFYDERLRTYWSDSDFHIRLKKKGYSVYQVLNSYVHHFQSMTTTLPYLTQVGIDSINDTKKFLELYPEYSSDSSPSAYVYVCDKSSKLYKEPRAQTIHPRDMLNVSLGKIEWRNRNGNM